MVFSADGTQGGVCVWAKSCHLILILLPCGTPRFWGGGGYPPLSCWLKATCGLLLAADGQLSYALLACALAVPYHRFPLWGGGGPHPIPQPPASCGRRWDRPTDTDASLCGGAVGAADAKGRVPDKSDGCRERGDHGDLQVHAPALRRTRAAHKAPQRPGSTASGTDLGGP